MTAEPALRRVGGLGSGAQGRQSDSLADVLERVLDKGIVIAGDVVVNVLDVELLTIRLRLFISSAETAREMGLDFWTRDPWYSGQAAVEKEKNDDVAALQARVSELEEMLGRLKGNGQRALPRGQDRR